eukprot:UN15566
MANASSAVLSLSDSWGGTLLGYLKKHEELRWLLILVQVVWVDYKHHPVHGLLLRQPHRYHWYCQDHRYYPTIV